MAADNRVTLRFFGRPSLRLASGLDLHLPKKAFLVALYLIQDTENMRGDRDVIALLFWPRLDSIQRLSNFRTLVKRINAAQTSSSVSIFRFEKQVVSLNIEVDNCDLLRLLKALNVNDARQLVHLAPLFRHELLEGCGNEHAGLEHWLFEHRSYVVKTFVNAGNRILAKGVLRSSPELELAFAKHIIEIDPIEEEAYRTLMQCYAASHDYNSVKATFDLLSSTLKHELGCQPLDITKLLYNDIINSSAAVSRNTSINIPDDDKLSRTTTNTTARLRAIDRPLLILNKIQLSSRDEQNASTYYDLFADDLAVQLWKPNIISVSFDDATLSSGNRETLPFVYDAYYVTLSISISKNVRLSARLNHSRANELLWAESFHLSDELYELILYRVAESIIRKVEDHQIDIARELDTTAVNSFVLASRADRELLMADLPALRRARRMFRTASQMSDSSARSYAGIARSYWQEWLLRAGNDPDLLMLAKDAALKAVNVNPDSYTGFRELGMISLYDRKYDSSIMYLSRSRSLFPSSPELQFDYADALVSNGNRTEGLELLNVNVRPYSRLNDYRAWSAATGLYLSGQYRLAVAEISSMVNGESAHRLRAACHAMLGEKALASEFMLKSVELNPDFNVKRWLNVAPFHDKIDVDHFFEGCRKAGFTFGQQ